jgi:hypothetical protein
MSKKLRDNYNVRIKQPIDTRFQCTSLNEIDTPYEGLKTFQLSDNKYYKYINNAWVDDNNDIENIIADDISTINTEITGINTKLTNNGVVNVKDYGALDGVDSTQAFIDAINACPIGGKVLVPPTPTFYYVKLGSIVLNKSITLEGITSSDDQQNGNLACRIVFTQNNTQSIGISVQASGVIIRNIAMYSNSDMTNVYTAIKGDTLINITIERVWIRAFYYAIRFSNTLNSYFRQINIRDTVIGFDFFTLGTSLLLEGCWVENPSLYGYRFLSQHYCTLVNCLCDGNPTITTARPNSAYYVVSCTNFNMVGCANERCLNSALVFDTCEEVTVNNYICDTGNMNSSGGTSLAVLSTSNKNIIFSGVRDLTPYSGTSSSITKGYNGTTPPIMIGCTLPFGYNDVGVAMTVEDSAMYVGLAGITQTALYVKASDTGARKKIEVTGAGVISAT